MLTAGTAQLAVVAAPSTVAAVGIVIPARDEAGRIGAAVAAIAASCRTVAPVCTIVVVDDASTDGTASIAREALQGHTGPSQVLTVCAGRASTARRMGCEAFRATVADPRSAWLLSTDADSVVPLDWVDSYLRHHERGEVAVAGIVSLLDDADGRRIVERWHADYDATIAPDRTHPHVHAANLGVRLDVFERVGGFRDLDRIEDIELWDRIRAHGLTPRADADTVVATSARMHGRVRAGFAAAIERLYG